MLNADELEMFRYELDHNFPMFSEWEKEKLMDLAEHGTSGQIRVLTALAKVFLWVEESAGKK